MGAIRIIPADAAPVILTSVLDGTGAAVALYADKARSSAVTLPYTASAGQVLYVATSPAGSRQVWLKATDGSGTVLTGSGATARPMYDVLEIPTRDNPPVELALDARDNQGFKVGRLTVVGGNA